ncbi:hypothetical protein K457DRAFT_515561 [Linnemannia elongata AG-77]|uniref:Uncharacterized protein n=1 Tax=Linnemannia elongata AG-77 TaxID=1314771 RepID=A0A197JXP0_9FUNG|nr:hypothetical protein K457DRAFT_515561 [Linnemannia elongata AG-77]
MSMLPFFVLPSFIPYHSFLFCTPPRWNHQFNTLSFCRPFTSCRPSFSHALASFRLYNSPWSLVLYFFVSLMKE